jgi:branched-chain amino acid transport system permease protein
MGQKHLTLIFIGILAVAFPFLVPSDYYLHLVIIALMWVVIGSAWNLLAGYTGQVSFGHAMFFGVGAYTAGIIVTKLEMSAWWGMMFGGGSASD